MSDMDDYTTTENQGPRVDELTFDGTVADDQTLPEPRVGLSDAEATRLAEAALVTTSLRLPAGLLRRLKECATQQGTTPSALVRTWIEAHLTIVEGSDTVVMVRLAELHRAIDRAVLPDMAA